MTLTFEFLLDFLSTVISVFITAQRAMVHSKLLSRPRDVGYHHFFGTIMLKLHLVDLLSICYTANLQQKTVTNRTDGA